MSKNKHFHVRHFRAHNPNSNYSGLIILLHLGEVLVFNPVKLFSLTDFKLALTSASINSCKYLILSHQISPDLQLKKRGRALTTAHIT